MIQKWFKEAGEGVSYSVIAKDPPGEITKLDLSNIFWAAFKKSCDEDGVELQDRIMAGATDARFVRAVSINFILIFFYISHICNFYRLNFLFSSYIYSKRKTTRRLFFQLGIPALGFSPINCTTSLPYGPNEYLNKKVFLKGIDIFVKVIKGVANA